MPYSSVQFAAHPGFLPVCGALGVLFHGMTAALLLSKACIAGGHAALRLGEAYLFAALMAVSQMLALPGVVAHEPLIGGDSAGTWLWCAGHVGFAAYVFRFLSSQATSRAGSIAAMSARLVAFVAGLTLLSAFALPSLPPGKAGLVATGLGPMVFVLAFSAAALTFVRLRCRTVLGLWLSVALFAGCLDVALTLAGNGRFTVGWYAARSVSLLSSACLLYALLHEVVTEARRVGRANVRLEQMVQTDVLTGMANRRAFDLAINAEWRRAQREQTTVSLLMIDIDMFKSFNDRYGHPNGDACLRSVGLALSSQACRPGDMAARLGGEEFAILLPVTEEGGALQVAERLRASVASHAIAHGGSSTGFVTISIGAATMRPFNVPGGPGQLMMSADTALYQAKGAGRDTVRGCGRPPKLLVAAAG